ncbi:hypothetical protein [Streptomyces sp. NPDC002078]
MTKLQYFFHVNLFWVFVAIYFIVTKQPGVSILIVALVALSVFGLRRGEIVKKNPTPKWLVTTQALVCAVLIVAAPFVRYWFHVDAAVHVTWPDLIWALIAATYLWRLNTQWEWKASSKRAES